MGHRLFSFVSCTLCCILVAAGCGQVPSSQDLQGRWAEKSAERIAAVFTPAGDGYDVYIGWREPGLAQYEVWEMTATPSRNKFSYKDGRHSYLTFEHEGDVLLLIKYSLNNTSFTVDAISAKNIGYPAYK